MARFLTGGWRPPQRGVVPLNLSSICIDRPCTPRGDRVCSQRGPPRGRAGGLSCVSAGMAGRRWARSRVVGS
jgi:hypothetical protein